MSATQLGTSAGVSLGDIALYAFYAFLVWFLAMLIWAALALSS